MKLTGATNNTFSSVVNSVKSIATKLPLKVVVASALLIGFTGSMAMDSFVLTASSYAKTVTPVKAQSAVKFKDANFEARLREQIGIPKNTPLTLNVLQGVKVLNFTHSKVTSLEGIQALRNLTSLDLRDNQISDVKPLAALTNLTRLNLDSNQISDVKPLAALTNLTRLDLYNNKISDVKPLAGLTKLTWLLLNENEISDVKPLRGLINLTFLGLRANKISDVEPLLGLTKLTWLELSGNPINNYQSLAEKLHLAVITPGILGR